MQVMRLAMLALIALCAGSGCRTAGVDELARPGPPLASNPANVAAILAEHNRNAERIQVMRAKPDLTVVIKERGKPDRAGGLYGRLALEQPRNFKLELTQPGGSKVGDLGSNEREYWFWVKALDKTQKAIYYCNYGDAEVNAQAVTFQPDWIKEAMGLRVIPEEEAADITVTSGEPGKLVLTHRPHQSSGKVYTRVTILDRATHQILEHRLLSGDQKAILARAEVPEGYMQVTPDSKSDDQQPVQVPKRLKLYWVQDGLELDVVFRDVKVNVGLTDQQRQALFVEPPSKGYARINLAERPPGTAASASGPTTIRETRPAPPSGVRLRAPTAIDGSETGRDVPATPLALSGEEPTVPSLSEGVVGARYPSGTPPNYLPPSDVSPSWRNAASPLPIPQ